ncbi:MAG: DMSO reductase family type II enzyme heme b subunit [Planctomycetota bacterium]|jgi:DMSO reductase family type II enzyme heme b subunit
MLRTVLLAGISAFAFVACAVHEAPKPVIKADRGGELFARHCAMCHGATGDADTSVARMLLPRPNAFRDGLFKLVSTSNGVPTNDDLIATLRRGMPGSSMMSYGWMPDDDLQALAAEVQRLTLDGRAEQILATAHITREPMTAEQALATAERQLLPDATVIANFNSPATASQLTEGERLYERHCAGCHGIDGRGLATTRNWPTDGTWLRPRDFTAGYLRGGASHRQLAYRVRAGMPAAHMPPVMLADPETHALVAYVRTLIPDEAMDHHVQWRRNLHIESGPALKALSDVSFDGVDAVRLPLVPLRWRANGIEEAWLRVRHDGDNMVMQLEWEDATRDDRVHPSLVLGDGVAIQFATTTDTPLFAMGSAAAPVNIWRWHAFDPKETAGMVDLMMTPPHSGLDDSARVQPTPRSESIQLEGLQSVGDATANGLPLEVRTSWHEGRWRVTFRRSLAPRGREVDLTGSHPVLFAIAIWDGSKDRGPGSKSITTWHQLVLAR